MHLSSLFLAALPFAPLVHGQQNNNYTTGLVSALNSLGLTTLATALTSATLPPALFSALQEGNHTVFAPSNAALTSGDPSSLTNLANVLAYHVTAGHVDTDSLNENATIVRSSLSTEPAVLLPANQSQVLVVSKASNGTITIENNNQNVHTSTNATYQNLQVFVIDHVLRIPGNFSSVVAAETNLSALAGAVTAALPDLVPTLTRTRGLTLFAPVNSAIQAVSEQLPQLNTSTLTNVLLNHLINGTAIYSSQINSNTNLTSAGGEPTTFVSNSSGIFITSGSSTAKIIKANILTSNGVIHLIDSVLLNTGNNPTQASSAAASYSSVQATQTSSQTGAVTGGPGGTGGGAGSLIMGGGETMAQLKVVFGALLVGGLLGAHLL